MSNYHDNMIEPDNRRKDDLSKKAQQNKAVLQVWDTGILQYLYYLKKSLKNNTIKTEPFRKYLHL